MRFSRTFKSSPHCLPSPDGTLIATLFQSTISFRSIQTLEVANVISLPPDLSGPVSAFIWSPSSMKVLVAVGDQIHVFSAQGTEFHAVIRNPAAPTTTKPTYVQFGATDMEVCVFSAFGLKFALYNLQSSKAVEINNPKLYHATFAPRGFSFRPDTGHLVLMTRIAGKDVVSIHHPVTREVQRSWHPDTVDAQGLTWTPDGRWLVVWESAAQRHKILVYTPDGHLFKAWAGPACSTGDSKDYELGAGVKLCQLSPDSRRAAVCDHTRCICILDMAAVTEAMRLQHPITITPEETVQIWQEQISVAQAGSATHTFIRATQTVSPPTRQANSSGGEAKPSSALLAFDASSTLLAATLDDSPSTIWIWDLAAAELRAVLIFHGNITHLSWHPALRELLMVACEGDSYGGLRFVWDPLSNGPRSVDFVAHLSGTMVLGGKFQGTWVTHAGDSAALLLGDAKHYMLASVAESEQSQAPWHGAVNGDWTTGLNAEEAPLENTPAAYDDQDLSGSIDGDMSEVDDTFSFRKL